MIDERWQAVQKVLLIRLDNLGDVLLTTPAFHAVKAALPHASLTLLASSIGAQVGKLNPDIDEVIVYAAPWMDPWHKLPQDSEREQRMIAQLKDQHFDGAIIFTSFRQSPLPAAYLCYLADIPLRAAASIDGPGSLLTTRHKHPERMMHEVERGLDLVHALGIEAAGRDLVLHIPPEATERLCRGDSMHELIGESSPLYGPHSLRPCWQASQLPPCNSVGATGAMNVARTTLTYPDQFDKQHHDSSPLVVVHPGCSMPARTYPWEMYAEVIDLLVQQLGVRVAVTGAEDERPLVAQICERISPASSASVIPLAGVLAFPELCALIKRAELTITNNTGPMHIAAAVKTPVVALFALTNPPEQWGPWQVAHRQLYHDVPCRICYSRVCPYQHECLRLVSPAMVVQAARELLAEARQTGAAVEVTP